MFDGIVFCDNGCVVIYTLCDYILQQCLFAFAFVYNDAICTDANYADVYMYLPVYSMLQ